MLRQAQHKSLDKLSPGGDRGQASSAQVPRPFDKLRAGPSTGSGRALRHASTCLDKLSNRSATWGRRLNVHVRLGIETRYIIQTNVGGGLYPNGHLDLPLRMTATTPNISCDAFKSYMEVAYVCLEDGWLG